VSKAADASVEFLGRIQCDDWLEINTGTMIAGPGCILAMGNRHQNIIAPKGTLVLMSGATFTIKDGKLFDYDLDVFGKVLAGTPERPLTTDAYFALNGRGKTKEYHPAASGSNRSLKLEPIGAITVTSADPAKARLVFKLAEHSKFRQIDLQLAGTMDFNGVLFEDVAQGGIQVRDAEVRKGWKNVFFGERNAGKPDELFALGVGTKLNQAHDEQKAAVQQLKELAEEAAKAGK